MGCFSHSPSLPPRSIILLVALCLVNACAGKCQRSFNVGSSQTAMNLTHCKHLSQLGATLSWTYHAASGSVDVAFKAKPAAKFGWVSWGINPSATGMVGTQALIAFRQPNGTMFTGTYNVISKDAPPPLSNLSFPVANLTSEFRHGMITIYATLVLPSNKSMVNQVWQVGSSVDGINPGVHAFDDASLSSLGPIQFLNAKIPGSPPTATATATAPAPAPSITTGSSSSSSTSRRVSLSLIMTLLPALPFFLGMS